MSLTAAQINHGLREFGYDPDDGDQLGAKTAVAMDQLRVDHGLTWDADVTEVLEPYYQIGLLRLPAADEQTRRTA